MTVNILTNISVDMLTNTMYIDRGVQRSKKIEAISFKMLLKVIVDQKGHVGEIQYFG